MDENERIERARQAIMRFRELLDLMGEELARGEREYSLLFAHLSREETATLKVKDLQGRAALDLIDHPETLGKPALHMRFAARNLERDFEQLYDNLMASE